MRWTWRGGGCLQPTHEPFVVLDAHSNEGSLPHEMQRSETDLPIGVPQWTQWRDMSLRLAMIQLRPARITRNGGIVAIAIMDHPMMESQMVSDVHAMRIPATPISMQKKAPKPR